MLREVTYSSVRIGAYEPIRSFFGDKSAAFSHQYWESNSNYIRYNNIQSSTSPTMSTFFYSRADPDILILVLLLINHREGRSSPSSTTTTPAVKFASALVSGGVGAAMANPLDLIKVRFQVFFLPSPSASKLCTTTVVICYLLLLSLVIIVVLPQCYYYHHVSSFPFYPLTLLTADSSAPQAFAKTNLILTLTLL